MEQAIQKTISDQRTVNSANIAATTLLICDVLCKLPDEIRYIWRTRWTSPKYLYVMVRYWGLVQSVLITMVWLVPNGIFSAQFCQGYYWTLCLSCYTLLAVPVNSILTLRLYSLYGRNRKVLIFLVLLSLAAFSCDLASVLKVALSLTLSEGEQTRKTAHTGEWQNCSSSDDHSKLYILISWAVNLVISATFFAMMLWRMRSDVQDEHGRRVSLCRMKTISPLFMTFFSGGTVHFFSITAAFVSSLLFTILVPGPRQALPLLWIIVVYAIAGPALILSLRKAGALSERGQPISVVLDDLSSRSRAQGIVFAQDRTSRVSGVAEGRPIAGPSRLH